MKIFLFSFLCLLSVESKSQSDPFFFIGTWTDNSIFQIDNEKGITEEDDVKTVTFNSDNTGYFYNKGDKIKHPFIWKYYSYSPIDLTMITDNGKSIKWAIKKINDSQFVVAATIDRKKYGICDYYIVSVFTKKQ